MSLKENLRRREIRNHGYVSADAICGIEERIKQKKEQEELKNSPIYLKDCIRRSALQMLDKSNTSSIEKRIENTIKFYNKTLEIFTFEYNSLDVKDEKALKILLYTYRTHIAKLNAFDNEVEFNGTTYTQKLTNQFALKLIELDSSCASILNLKQQNNTL